MHKAMTVEERQALRDRLRGNAGADVPVWMARDTSFLVQPPDGADEQVIDCIKSVPSHY